MLLIYIWLSQIFSCLKLHIISGYWAIGQLVLSIGAIRRLTHSSNLYFIEITIEHFTYLHWKPTWFKKLYQLGIVIGIADPQVASTERLDVFCRCCCSLMRKNIFVCVFSVHKTYNKVLLVLIRQLDSFLVFFKFHWNWIEDIVSLRA